MFSLVKPCEACGNDFEIKRTDKKGQRFCSINCSSTFLNKNRVWTEKSRNKLSKFHKGRPLSEETKRKISEGWKARLKNGAFNSSYKDGRRIFRKTVFEGELLVCQVCGKTKNLVAHHIEPCEYLKCGVGIKPGNGDHSKDNGAIVCRSCHSLIHKGKLCIY